MPSDKKVIWSYNKYADKWAKKMRSGGNNAHKYLEKPAMYAKLPDLRNKSVLCVGCGTGEECGYIKSLGVKKIIGIDISKEIIRNAKERYPEIKFHVMDMEKINFKRSSFDFVYSSLVLHYLKDWTKVLKNIHKVLKKNGTFLFSTHHPMRWGAEKKRFKDKKSILMGYTKYSDGKRYQVYGDYFKTRKIKDLWFDKFEISYYHRPLSSTVRDILKSGFEIIDFIEPKAINSVKNKDKMFWDIRRKIPLFMIFELRKK